MKQAGCTKSGIHYALGYCGTGVSRATYFGTKIALKVLDDPDGRTSFDDLAFPAFPAHEKSDAYAQACATLAIVDKALKDAGASATDVVRTVAYLHAINDAEAVAKAHLEMFDAVRPASTLVQVASMLRPWQKVEIEAYAKLGTAR